MIAVSPRIQKRVPAEMGLHDKSMQYLEQSMASWVQSQGALCMMLPAPESGGGVRMATVSADDYAEALDGLLLQGGKDLDPALYGQTPEHIIGEPDPVRDRFELDLVQAFHARRKPVFGICRGMQLINVALGGSLYQDLAVQGASAYSHVESSRYDQHHHALCLQQGEVLADWYGTTEGRVNSIHHQGVATLGRGLKVVARASDGVIEAIWGLGEGFLLGVQWHPEFQDGRDPALLPGDPLMRAFLDAAQQRRDADRA